MNRIQETKRIQVNNGQGLIAAARKYKNSGGEWKLRERYVEMPTGKSAKEGAKKYLEWGIIIGNGKEEIDIRSAGNNVCSRSGPNDEIDVRDELETLFPAAKGAPFADGRKGRKKQERLDTNTCKRIKESAGEYDLIRYLVAEDFRFLELIIRDYFRKNEARIYNSANHHFSNWVEIIDGQDGNMYLYVGEKKGWGREIKIGIKKDEYERAVKNYKNKTPLYEKSKLEVSWDLLILSSNQSLTPAEQREYYSSTGGLEEEWARNWPRRQGLCRKYLESLRGRLNEKFNYWQEKTRQKQYWDHEANEQGILAKVHIAEIDALLADMKKNRPAYYDACDSDCSICEVKLCCHHEGQACEKGQKRLVSIEKNQIKQYFLQNKIKRITLEGDNLVVEYNNSAKERQAINSHELQKYRPFIAKQPNQSLSLAELETNTLTNQNNNKLYQSLAIGGTVGIVIFLMGYLVFKKKKKAL